MKSRENSGNHRKSREITCKLGLNHLVWHILTLEVQQFHLLGHFQSPKIEKNYEKLRKCGKTTQQKGKTHEKMKQA